MTRPLNTIICLLYSCLLLVHAQDECKDVADYKYRGIAKRTCAKWVSKRKNRCKLKEKSGTYAGKRVKEMCPVTCRCAAKTCEKCPVGSCFPDSVRKRGRCGGDESEGGEKTGYKAQWCNKTTAKWQDLGCLEESRLHAGAGFPPAEWDYSNAPEPANGVYGWSYYIRAYDLIRDTPVREIGWGQWSKPGAPTDGLEVCGLHPHGFTCEETTPDEWTGSLKGCGSTSYTELEQCKEWCCGEEDKCGVRGSIEGGMGYWMYTVETPHVKWMLPGATNANYEIFGGTFLNDRPQACSTLGGAVRISNSILIPNSFVHFDQGSDGIDGFMGYMLTRTPIGKRSTEDNANYWTIIIDALNFSGPVMYMSAWFWDSRINWNPKSVSWSDHRALITYIAQGFEGSIGTHVLTHPNSGRKWIKTSQIAFPKDNGSDTTTLFTGHSQFDIDWAAVAMEPMLSGTGSVESQKPSYIMQSYMKDRVKPECNTPNEDSAWGLETDETNDEPETDIGGFGIGDEVPADATFLETSDAASCHTRLTLTTKKLKCKSEFCKTRRYIRQRKKGSKYVPIPDGKVPKYITKALNLLRFEPTKLNDGRYLGPPAKTEKVCFDTPGPSPSDSRLYCTRTQSGTWLGFKWYRFIDQPELNQVFASMGESERDSARCFMQARIERLHEAQNSGEGIPRWFDAPQGAGDLPKTKVGIDPALLLTPPEGLEKGFVPIPLYERNREMPANCEVFVGSVTEEPNPLPEDYYYGHANDWGTYEEEVCPANPESGGPYTYPGTIFSYHPTSDQSTRKGYTVPVRSEVKLDDPIMCNLASDPPNAGKNNLFS